MKIISKSEYLAQKDNYLSLIKSGSIFIYPTDTIYGIGCNALVNNSIKKIRDMKERPSMPFSIIVPNKEWIYQYCEVGKHAEEWIAKLPGPYTLVLKVKMKGFFSDEIAPGLDTIGVRIPAHWISDIAKDLGYPIITTSVNKKGASYMTSTENLDADIEQKVELMIYEGEKNGRPSEIIHLENEQVVSKKR